jgi:hypothetical protein
MAFLYLTAGVIRAAPENPVNAYVIFLNWGSSLRLTLVEKYQRSSVDLTPNQLPLLN